MKLFTTIILFVMILAVTLHFGCNNTTGVEPQKFPFIRFSKTYPASEALDVQPSSDGGYVAIGLVFNFKELLLFKTDKDGILEWNKRFNFYYDDMSTRILETTDGYLIFGSKSLPSPTYYYNLSIIKTDKSGNELWSKVYADTIPNDVLATIEQATDGGFLIAFSRQLIKKIFINEEVLFKISETGEVIWRKVFYQDSYSYKPFIARCNNDGYLILSKLANGPNTDSVLIVKTDLAGNTIWQNKYAANFFPTSLIALHDGNFIAAGIIYPDSDEHGGLMKINSNGEIEWTKSYQGNSYQSGIWDRLWSVVETIDGNVIAVGHTNRTILTSGTHSWIMQADKNGNEIWSFIPPGNRGDALYSVKHVRDNMYIAAGQTYSEVNPNEHAWLLNLDLTPCEQWVKKK